MNMHEVNEKDWKLFRSRVGEWQEAYMEKLCREYAAMLTGDGSASEKFWELDKRIYEDKRSPGVILEMKRSLMDHNIMQLLDEEVISLDDLEGFSDEFRNRMHTFMRRKTIS